MNLLLELLDFSYPIFHDSNGAYFKPADGTKVYVSFDPTPEGPIVIEFVRADEKDEYPEWNITGQGDAVKIFSTVALLVRGYLKKFKPPAFYFTAKERSRIKLYDRMADRFDGYLEYKHVTSGPHYDDLLDWLKGDEDKIEGKLYYFENPQAVDDAFN